MRQNNEEAEIFEPTLPSFDTEQYKKPDMNIISNITMFLGEELKRFTNIYYAKKMLTSLTEQPEKFNDNIKI